MKQWLTSGKFGGAPASAIPRMLVALCAFICIIIVLLILPPRHSKSGYMAASIDKHRLLESLRCRKIVLVGGSNLAFGTDSQQMEKELGLPVVNMGLHAGLGLRYMLDEVKPYLNKNDIVLIVPEYEQFGSLTEGYLQQHMQLLEVSPARLTNLMDSRRANMIATGLPGYLKKKLIWYKQQISTCFSTIRKHGKCSHGHLQQGMPCTPYARSAYNKYGDVTAHLDMPTPGIATQVITIPRCADPKSIQSLNEFQRFTESKGVSSFLCFPTVPKSKFESQKPASKALYANLKAQLEIPILSQPEKYVLPDDCFFDTCYHLTRRGINRKMPMISADLNHALNMRTAHNSSGTIAQ